MIITAEIGASGDFESMKKNSLEVYLLVVLIIALGLSLLDIKPLSIETKKILAERSSQKIYFDNKMISNDLLDSDNSGENNALELSNPNFNTYQYFDFIDPTYSYLQKRASLIALANKTAEIINNEKSISKSLPMIIALEKITIQILTDLYKNPKIIGADQDLYLINVIWNLISEKVELDNNLAIEAENMLLKNYPNSQHLKNLEYNYLSQTENNSHIIKLKWSSENTSH